MKTRILSLTTMIALLLTLAACSSDEAPDNFEPRLVTGEASGVTRTEAVIAGEVMLQGSTDMPELRFRYGTTDQMDHTTGVLDPDGNKVKIQLTGLQPGTMYYYRLHGTNGRVELHGNTMTFVTMPNDRPTVGVPAVLSQGPMSVIVEYEITDDGNETITSTGCYVTDIETGDTQSVEAETPGAEGVGMRVRIGGLRQNATYEIKAYAANGEGESVGEALTITTSDAVLLADAGEFEELMGDSKYEYTTLSIAGPMNGDDLRCLRQMMGRDIDGSATAGRLAQVNMADAHIVEGGGVYGSSRYTENNVVGYGLFADCTLLTSVTLPSDAVKIEKDAFMNCTALREITIPASATGISHRHQSVVGLYGARRHQRVGSQHCIQQHRRSAVRRRCHRDTVVPHRQAGRLYAAVHSQGYRRLCLPGLPHNTLHPARQPHGDRAGRVLRQQCRGSGHAVRA